MSEPETRIMLGLGALMFAVLIFTLVDVIDSTSTTGWEKVAWASLFGSLAVVVFFMIVTVPL
jgi:hypothetical protein